MKHIKCQNDWSIEVSKPFKMILKLSLLKKTKRDGFDGCYEWADYFDFAEVKQNIHKSGNICEVNYVNSNDKY